MIQPPDQNILLAALPELDLKQLLPHLALVPVMLGETLQNAGERLRYAYFPTTSIISLNRLTESGSSTEIAGVGHEGVVGYASCMGGETTLDSAIVQSAGQAFRLDQAVLTREFARSAVIRRVILRYVHSLMMQIAQIAVCNRHHSIDQQLCRWLLQAIDRLSGRELVMTQELISNALGVRRESITEAAGKLKVAGCIMFRRGHISILDRRAIESRACECYSTVKTEMTRLSATNDGRTDDEFPAAESSSCQGTVIARSRGRLILPAQSLRPSSV
jgi:CRP-like cAMP-binding protein